MANDFSKTVGARYKRDGDFSGEEFREKLLVPKYSQARSNNTKLIVDLDGGYGYPRSFLEEAFGGLASEFDGKDILSRVIIISEEEPSLVNEIKAYVRGGEGYK